jgi:hypothetical protein
MKNPEIHNYPRYALNFEAIKKLSDPEVLNRIRNIHGIELNEIFSPNRKKAISKFSTVLMSRLCLMKLEGVSGKEIEKYLTEYFEGTEYDDLGESDLLNNYHVRYSLNMSDEVKKKRQENLDDLLFRLTVWFNIYEKEGLRDVVNELIKEYEQATDKAVSIYDIFARVPKSSHVNSNFSFAEKCRYMLETAYIKKGKKYEGNKLHETYTKKDKDIMKASITQLFTSEFRDAIFRDQIID